jgi:serine/threonine protein phosphatase PrpC
LKLEYLEGLSWPGDRSKPNEDAFCHADTIAAVFDGATGIADSPVLPSDSDAAWIARKGAERLIANDVLGARGALRRAAMVAERDFNATKLRQPAERYELPLASMMLVAPEDGRMLALWLGDCAALVQRPGDGTQLIGDNFERRARESRRAARFAREFNVAPVTGKRDAFLPAMRKSRNLVNTVEGSWAFSPDAACADHAQSLEFDAPPGTHILVCSDGFLSLACDYGRCDVDGLMKAAMENGLRSVIEEIRAIEEADADGRRFPRFKKSDDATALLLRLM